MKTISIFLISFLFAFQAFAQGKKVAVVKIIRGEVDVLTLGKTTRLNVNDWVQEGSVVKTADKSFAKLIFVDRSQINIGPNSEMKIEKFSGDDAGVIDLVKGKVRSQVTKTLIQDRSKMFIKTPNAVMGIRGTDFVISFNGKNTSTVLFEGSVLFAKLEGNAQTTQAMENLINRAGERVFPGQFSVVMERLNPTIPSYLNKQQLEALEKNDGSESNRNPDSGNQSAASKSVVPQGLSGAVVSNDQDTIKSEVAAAAVLANTETTPAPQSAPAPSGPEGYVKGDQVKPANGSFVHIESGTIIPPGPDSVLDKNTNSYIPGPGQGTVNASGEYIPPKNVEITSDGKILVAFKDQEGAMRVQEIEKPVPIITNMNLSDVGNLIVANPTLINPTAPIRNDILNKSFMPNGLNDLSNNQLNQTGGVSNITEAASQNARTKVNIQVQGP
jgi:hypothetical protein